MSATTTATAELPSLLVRTRELDTAGAALGASELLALLPQPQPQGNHVWLRRGEGLVGWGQAYRIDTAGADRFERAAELWHALRARMVVRDDVDLPGSGPVAFGSFNFATESAAGSVLIVPEVVIGTRDGRTWITTISPATDLTGPPSLSQLRVAAEPWAPQGAFTPQPGALSPDQWQQQVQAVIGRIRSGEVSKVVMSRDERGTLSEQIDVRRVLTGVAEEYPTCWTFAVDGLVGATPELLIRRERGLVSSRVLAGTIRRTGDDQADLARAASLARSSKDLEEHEFAVSSLTEALRPVAASTNAPDAPFVLHLPNVMHLATDVTAVLDAEHAHLTALDLAALLHPTAAVCGTPTEIADAIIAEHEQMDRRRYTGPVGWIGGDGDGEWGIALRCAEVDADGRGVRMFAGCGIVAASDPEAELREANMKLQPMRSAFTQD